MSLEAEAILGSKPSETNPFEIDMSQYQTRNSQNNNALKKESSNKSFSNVRQSTYLGKRSAVDNSLRSSLAAAKNTGSKYLDKTLPKINE